MVMSGNDVWELICLSQNKQHIDGKCSCCFVLIKVFWGSNWKWCKQIVLIWFVNWSVVQWFIINRVWFHSDQTPGNFWKLLSLLILSGKWVTIYFRSWGHICSCTLSLKEHLPVNVQSSQFVFYVIIIVESQAIVWTMLIAVSMQGILGWLINAL